MIVNCPKCESNVYCKNGIARGLRRYLCKKYNYSYTVAQNSRHAGLSIKQKALQLYLEGLGFRAIERILNFSNVAILNCVRILESK